MEARSSASDGAGSGASAAANDTAAVEALKAKSEEMKRRGLELLKTTTETVHIISTPFGSQQGRSLALKVAKACERSDSHFKEFCYNPNEDCPQTLGIGWLDTWMEICDNTVKTGGKVFVIFRSDGKGEYGCDPKGPKSLDGQAQPGEVRYALSKGCDIHWMDSTNPEAAMLALRQGADERLSERARTGTDADGTSSDHGMARAPESARAWISDLIATSKQPRSPEEAEELEQMRRELSLQAARMVAAMQRPRMRGKVKVDSEPTSVLDLSALKAALEASLAEMVTKVTGGQGTPVDRAALRELCGSLSRDDFASVQAESTPRLRGGLDAVARRPQANPPQITLIEPSNEHQARLRGIARTRDMCIADFEEGGGTSSASGPAAGGESASCPSGGRWTSVESGQPLLFQLSGLQRGFCYLLHLNEKDKLSVVFPMVWDRENEVREGNGTLHVPTGFHEGKRYMRFNTEKGVERETFYLLSTTMRLDEFPGVGQLPEQLGKLPEPQARAILTAIEQHVHVPSGPRTRDMDVSDFVADVFDADGSASGAGVSMALSTLMLISVAKP